MGLSALIDACDLKIGESLDYQMANECWGYQKIAIDRRNQRVYVIRCSEKPGSIDIYNFNGDKSMSSIMIIAKFDTTSPQQQAA